jgi:hypothetical protein
MSTQDDAFSQTAQAFSIEETLILMNLEWTPAFCCAAAMGS